MRVVRRCAAKLSQVQLLEVCCTPGWTRSVLNVTYLRRYSAASAWDELRPTLALDPQRRRPLLMWQRHSKPAPVAMSLIVSNNA